MSFERDFRELWEKQEFEVPGVTEDLCFYAQRYSEWTARTIANVEVAGSVVAVNQGMLRITQKYFEWRTVVPKSHRNRIGETGHRCIFHVFEAGYQKLKSLELALAPPPLTLPPPPPAPALPPPPPPPIQIAGIFLGEDDT